MEIWEPNPILSAFFRVILRPRLRQWQSEVYFLCLYARASMKTMSIPFPTLDIIPRRGYACQEKTYAGLCKDLGRFAYNFADLTTFHAKRGDFASRPLEFASVD